MSWLTTLHFSLSLVRLLRRRSQNSSSGQRGLESFSNSPEMFVLRADTGRILLFCCCFGVCWFTCDSSYTIPAGSLLKCVAGSQFASCGIPCSSFSWWEEASAVVIAQVLHSVWCCKGQGQALLSWGSSVAQLIVRVADTKAVVHSKVSKGVGGAELL